MELIIDKEVIDSRTYFVIKEKAKELIDNKRLLLSLKRLDHEIRGNDLLVPYKIADEANKLKALLDLLTRQGIKTSLSATMRIAVSSFERENQLFDILSEKAKAIRNNEFDDYVDLTDDLRDFRQRLKDTLKRPLYPLQELAAFHMTFAQNSCNFAVPGAGKTSIVYAAYAYLKGLPKEDPRYVNKLLVLGPLSSFAPWENEYKECFGKDTTFQRLSGDLSLDRSTKLRHLYSGDPAEVTLIFHGGVDGLQNDIIAFLKKHPTMIVVDEAHRIKNPDGVWGRSAVAISKEARSRVVLTGTPVPNGYQDLFNLYQFIYPFKYKDILKVHYQNLEDMTISSPLNDERVRRLKVNISPFFIRIKKSDLKLPPIQEHVIKIEMDTLQREIYELIETRYIQSFQKNPSATIKDILNKAKLIRLRQASTNPGLLTKTLKHALANDEINGEYDPNSRFTTLSGTEINDSEFFFKINGYSTSETPKKFIAVKELLSAKILPDGKAVIWTIFIQNAKELQTFLNEQGISTRLLIGEVPQEERESIIRKFNSPDNKEFNVVIANPFSVAESVSMHKGCHHAIYLERDYNCSNFLQSKDRIHRVGLAKDQVTNYYYILCNNSIDEVIDDRLRAKIAHMEAIINDDIPLFKRIDEDDETEIIKGLLKRHAG